MVVANSQNSDWLNRHCVALVNAHHELAEEHQAVLKDGLKLCREAATKRNELVHALFAVGDDESYLRVKGGRTTHAMTVEVEPLWPP